MYDIDKIIIPVADMKLAEIRDNGYVKPGNNGPYFCMDTPARNSSHWIGIYKYLYNKYKDKRYYQAIKSLVEYLCGEKCESSSNAIPCFLDSKMDHINGVIGQAWVIEGLVSAYQVMHDERIIDKGIKIFLSQSYDYENHIWERIELDGRNIGKDKVFNHQLWFAAAGSMLLSEKNHTSIAAEIKDFLIHVNEIFDIYDDGLIKHYVVGYEREETLFKHIARKLLFPLKAIDPKFDHRYFEKAYHLFNLYGFALLSIHCGNMLTENEKLKKAIVYGLSIEKLNADFNVIYRKGIRGYICKYNKYSYAYNSPAFEFPLIDTVFNNTRKENVYDYLIQIQMEITYNSSLKMFSVNTADPETLTARIYELTRFFEIQNEKTNLQN